MILSHEFPYLPTTYEILRVITTPREIIVQGRSRREWAECSRCGHVSHRVHSSYERRIWEQPCIGRPILLVVVVQRFRCLNQNCGCATFVEVLQEVAERHAQRTIGQGQAVQKVGLALGGNAGAQLAREMGLGKASASTVLRWVARVGVPKPAAPRVVGIDDWAWRRGQRYGTIVVDLERGKPIDLLADYSKEAIADWLGEHRQVCVVVRDRSKIGRAGADLGAPQAVQVADRFHLVKNLTDALAAGFERHPAPRVREPPTPADAASVGTMPAERPQSSKEQCYAQMQELRAAGYSIRAIAAQVGASRSTVQGWLMHGCPEADWVRKVRRRESRQQSGQTSTQVPSKQAAFLFVRSPDGLQERQREQLAFLLASRPDLLPLYQLAQRFVRLLQERDVTALLPWLQEAKACAWSQLRAVARGLSADLAAVQAALTLPWSNGPVEGLVNRLKLLKRSMYGRASLGLLRQRLLTSS